MRARIAVFVVIIQAILFLGYLAVYKTWTAFGGPALLPGPENVRTAFALLSVSFVTASVLAFRYSNSLVRVFYRIAGVWLGISNFLLMAAVLSWVAYFAVWSSGLKVGRPVIVGTMFGLAMCVSLYGLINARWVRVKRIRVRLPHLPESWKGRVTALVSDVHLGHVNGHRFLQRIVKKLRRLAPHAVFITGDLYDGSKVDSDSLVLPFKDLKPPFGAYYVTGNHEEFGDPARFLKSVEQSGVRVLNNEKVTVDGLQIVGVHHADLSNTGRFRSALKNADVDRNRASILLAHAPMGMAIAEEAGISLQLSGHTHGGQIFPFTWFTKRIFRQFTYGLQRFGELLVYTSSGAGTWGPPMRVGTRPEIVLIQFE